MALSPILRYTTFVWGVMPLVDQHAGLSVGDVRSHIENGTLFEWLGGMANVDLSLLDDDDRSDVLERFNDLLATDARRKFGVESSGDALLIAFANESIQQVRHDGH
jgi:hypothetical protein